MTGGTHHANCCDLSSSNALIIMYKNGPEPQFLDNYVFEITILGDFSVAAWFEALEVGRALTTSSEI